jgi:hypothetical protein
MSEAKYDIIEPLGTLCGECGSIPSLMKPKNMADYLPAFYICFSCGYVGEVGKGPVGYLHPKKEQKCP